MLSVSVNFQRYKIDFYNSIEQIASKWNHVGHQVTGNKTDVDANTRSDGQPDARTIITFQSVFWQSLFYNILRISQKENNRLWENKHSFCTKHRGKMRGAYLFLILIWHCLARVDAAVGATTTYYLTTSGQQLADDITRDESAVYNNLSCASRCADDVSCVTFTVCRQTTGKQ